MSHETTETPQTRFEGSDTELAPATLTIVTVSLNDLTGMQRTFESLAEQRYRNVQHILIDGGSTDGTVDWARANAVFAETTVVSEPDRGIYDAMNKGLRRADGDLVAFLNCGDRYVDDSVLATVAASCGELNWSWAYGFSRLVNTAGEQVAGGRVKSSYSQRRQDLWTREICHQATFMKSEFARSLGGFDPRYRIAADYRMFIQAGRATPPHVFPRVLVDVLEGGVSETRHWPSQLEAHQARVDTFGLGAGLAGLDMIWAWVMTARSLSRRRARRGLRAARSFLRTKRQ